MLYGDKNEILALIGGRMRSRRLRLNLTQQVAAERSGISVQTLKNLENGKVVSLWAFVSLCRTYGHDDWVYELEPEQVSDYAARIAAVKKKGSGRQEREGAIMYERVAELDVFLWGHHVGSLAPESGSFFVFQYDPEFVRTGLQIAPFMLPLQTGLYHTATMCVPKKEFMGIPGVFADSLPDSFGNSLINRWMRENGIPTSAISVLDRLAYVGSRGMGALTFKPKCGPEVRKPTALDMRELVEEARLALNERLSEMSGTDALREIIRVGTSAGGAQAKAVVGWNRETGDFLAGTGDLPDGYEHWLIKFTPKGMEDAGEKEFEVYRKALACGIEMSECRLFEQDGVKHFMTKRFDRDVNRRHHLQTYCALKHIPHSAPRELKTYEGIFHTIAELNLGYEALEQMFRRMAFNVKIEECDDHTKNFSFLMSESGKWRLAPAYDLTGYHTAVEDKDFEAWSNPHALSVNGKTGLITDDDLLLVAERFGIGTAKRALKEIEEVLA